MQASEKQLIWFSRITIIIRIEYLRKWMHLFVNIWVSCRKWDCSASETKSSVSITKAKIASHVKYLFRTLLYTRGHVLRKDFDTLEHRITSKNHPIFTFTYFRVINSWLFYPYILAFCFFSCIRFPPPSQLPFLSLISVHSLLRLCSWPSVCSLTSVFILFSVHCPDPPLRTWSPASSFSPATAGLSSSASSFLSSCSFGVFFDNWSPNIYLL